MGWDVTNTVVRIDAAVWIVAIGSIDAFSFAIAGPVGKRFRSIRTQTSIGTSVTVGIGGGQTRCAFDRYLTTAFFYRDGMFRRVANAIAGNNTAIWIVAIRSIDTLPFTGWAFDSACAQLTRCGGAAGNLAFFGYQIGARAVRQTTGLRFWISRTRSVGAAFFVRVKDAVSGLTHSGCNVETFAGRRTTRRCAVTSRIRFTALGGTFERCNIHTSFVW